MTTVSKNYFKSKLSDHRISGLEYANRKRGSYPDSDIFVDEVFRINVERGSALQRLILEVLDELGKSESSIK